VLANVLEGTSLRCEAISGIQFGFHFKNPLASMTPVILSSAWAIYNNASNEKLRNLLSPESQVLMQTEELFKKKFSEGILQRYSIDDIVSSISGITRKKDRLYELLSKWRDSTQDAWEAFVKSEHLSADSIAEGLKKPRSTWGYRWKLLVLNIADSVRFACLL
jgi:hypothetical protein